MNDLRELLQDAVADVEPADRLDELRARTADPVHAAARPWFLAAGATVLATAAAVTFFAVLDDGPAETGHDHHGMATNPPASSQLVPAYFLGDSPGGEARLFREFDEVPGSDPLQAALDRIQRPPSDPDYSTGWEHGTLVDATVRDGTIDVEVAAGQHLRIDELAAQQVVFTLQGSVGETLPVRFVQGDAVVLGPLTAEPDALNPVSISDPAEGEAYSGTMVARGRARSHLGSATWALMRGGVTVRGGTVDVGTGSSLTPWEVSIDLTGVDFGFYTFVLTEDSPEGMFYLPRTDTRTIIVR